MSEVLILLKRDFKNSMNRRFFIMLVFMLLFQIWIILGSDSVDQVSSTGVMHYMAVVFSFNFFGSIVALALNHDGISVERETKTLDLILTSGVSKKKVYISKILTCLLISGVFALLYLLVLLVVYFVKSGDIGMSLLTLRYVFPLMAFLFVFGLMGLLFSVIFRSSRTSLITSIIIGGVMMPRLFVMIVDSLSSIAGFSEKTVEILYMISPALMMNALNGYSGMVDVLWALLLMMIYLAVTILSGANIFTRQDELNYGE